MGERGWQVADLGCGPIGILDLLAERVGLAVSAVGVEREARLVEMARCVLDERQLADMQVIQADPPRQGEDTWTEVPFVEASS